MISDIISEFELKVRICEWLFKNQKGFCIRPYDSLEECAFYYRLPDDLRYRHTQSLADVNGDLLTLLKAEIVLRDWETRKGNKEVKFEFYKVLKTFTDTPEVEPYPVGYIIV